MVKLEGYTLGEALGEGAFAVCRLGHKNDNPTQKVAVKSLMRDHPNFDPTALQHEINIMKAINHPRCIGLIEVREDDKAVHLVEELASGGELFDRIIELGHFTEKDAVHLIHQVFDGIQYLHTHGMIHRDLKPENLLMVGKEPGTDEYMQLKIADFGLSAQRSESKSDAEWNKTLQEFCGTQDYLAPEVFKIGAARNKKDPSLHYTGKVDVWSCGVIYYIMLCGYPPFWPEDDEILKMIKQITDGDYSFHSPQWDPVSEDSKNFIRACLTVEVNDRPTSIECMNHPIFKNDNLPTEPLGMLDELAKYKARFKEKAVLKGVRAMARMELLGKSMHWEVKADDPRQKEADNLFTTIDSMGDRNGSLELFEIILYMQEHYQHIFSHKDVDGQMVVDEEKLKSFASFLRDSLDRDRDGLISKEEFIKGYCIWTMNIHKAEQQSMKNLLAKDVY